MTMPDYFKKVAEFSADVKVQEVNRARMKAQTDMNTESMVRDFFNPAIDTNPYKRGYESHMKEAYSEERLLLIEEWSRINGH